jgi:hypothetical protein
MRRTSSVKAGLLAKGKNYMSKFYIVEAADRSGKKFWMTTMLGSIGRVRKFCSDPDFGTCFDDHAQAVQMLKSIKASLASPELKKLEPASLRLITIKELDAECGKHDKNSENEYIEIPRASQLA